MQSKIELKKMVGEDPMGALTFLEEIFAKKEEKNNVNLILLLQSQYNEFKKSKAAGTIGSSDLMLSLNQIKLNIFSIIDDTSEEDFKSTENTVIQEKDFGNATFLEIFKLIRELADINIEIQKHSNHENYEQIEARFVDKQEVILNQIIKLVRITNFELSVPDYRLIGSTFERLLNSQKAEEFYQKATSKIDEYTDSASSKVNAIHTYAIFLYNSGRPEEGLKQFETAILQNNSELGKMLNGDTYSAIFFNEVSVSNFESGIAAYQKALSAYESLKDQYNRDFSIQRLEKSWSDQKKQLSNYKQPISSI